MAKKRIAYPKREGVSSACLLSFLYCVIIIAPDVKSILFIGKIALFTVISVIESILRGGENGHEIYDRERSEKSDH